jgi:hypothetical protein
MLRFPLIPPLTKNKKQVSNLKAEFLQELIANYTKWQANPDPEAQEYAAAYLKLINVFSTPNDKE